MNLTAAYLASGGEAVMFIFLPLVGGVMVAYGVFQVISDLRGTQQHKLMDRLQGRSADKKRKEASRILLRRGLDDAPRNALDSMVRKLSIVPKMQRTLDQADIPWSASRVLVNLLGTSILALVGCLVLQRGILWGVAVALGVFFLPLMYFSFRRKRRLSKLVMQLPDVFELLGQALRAGHSLAGGIGEIGEQMPDPVGGEFARVFQEQNLGIKIEEAMSNMAKRLDLLDVKFFVTAVLIARQTGGDLGEVLDKISAVIRERIELFGQVKALTAEGRMSGWVLLALPMVVFAAEMTLNPEYASCLITEPIGKALLFVALAMQIMGLGMIRMIVNIKV